MNFLILAEASSMHTYNYIKYILVDESINITLFSMSCKSIPEEYLNFYRQRNVKVVYYMEPSSSLAFKDNPIFRVIKFFKKCKALKKLGKFDVCQLEFINTSGCLLMYLNRKLYGFKLLTYWGSDILQISPKLKKVQYPLLKVADAITLCTEKMFRKFHETYGNEFDDKLHKVNIIVGNLSIIENTYHSYGCKKSKEYFEIPDNKLCVMCGYNGSSAQRQDTIVDLISGLSEEYRDKLFLVIPFMYGCSDKGYINRVKEKLKCSGVDYRIIERYLSYEEMAKLSLATDIYLQLRYTDALSASMQEQLYSGSVVVQGSWLEYDELDNSGLPIYKIDNIEELGGKLVEIVDNISTINYKVLPEYINTMSSGEMSRKQSMEIYGHINK